MNVYEVLLRPLITEKGTERQASQNKYSFEVARSANKHLVKAAVEECFKNDRVHVVKVNIMNMPGKQRRVGRRIGMTSDWKKAIVTLAPGQTITQFFEGV